MEEHDPHHAPRSRCSRERRLVGVVRVTVPRELHSGRGHKNNQQLLAQINLMIMLCGQALGLLVLVSSMHYCTSTSSLSTQWSTGILTPLTG